MDDAAGASGPLRTHKTFLLPRSPFFFTSHVPSTFLGSDKKMTSHALWTPRAPSSWLGRLRTVEHLLLAWVLMKLINKIRKLGLMDGLVKPVLSVIIAGARAVPLAKGLVESEVQKEVDKIESDLLGEGDEMQTLACRRRR